jgi:transcriptional regulator with XRE-family HTH domain
VKPSTFRRRVGTRIKRARWRMEWTQADAAHRVGLTFRYFAEVERGRRNPTIDVLLSIARGLEVRVADLVDVEPGRAIDLDSMELSPPKTGRKSVRARRR